MPAPLRVIPIPCLKDNYAYLVLAEDGFAAVVDPSEAAPVAAALERTGARLHAIWLTHHHVDHVGGVKALVERFGPLQVLGSEYDREKARIPCQTRGLDEGDALAFGGHSVQLLAIPGHTLGALAFVVDGCLFSGDTLFVSGCGRVFEGSMPMMQASLAKLRALPPSTKLYCGHEYTLANLRFAQSIEPGNSAIAQALERAAAQRADDAATVPGLLADELSFNPFLRWDAPAVAARARQLDPDASHDPSGVFGALRRAKDRA